MEIFGMMHQTLDVMNFPDKIWLQVQMTSTQDIAHSFLREIPSTSHSLLVVTLFQTAGRGRPGKSWYQGFPLTQVTCTAVVPATDWIHRWESTRESERLQMTAELSQMVLRYWLIRISERWHLPLPSNLRIKPPNDLYWGNQKVAGVLLERSGDHLLGGLGVNLCPERGEFGSLLPWLAPRWKTKKDPLDMLLSLAFFWWESLYEFSRS